MVVGILLSYWEGNFSGAMLNFGRVTRCEIFDVWYFFVEDASHQLSKKTAIPAI